VLPSARRLSASRASAPRLDGRVLVVDDSEAKRYTLAAPLRGAGMEVLEAASGQEALAAMALRPDVVVLDVRLPDMDGFEVSRQLKADPATAAIPLLYSSALLEDAALEARLFEDGADGYIPQPVEPKHLVAQTWALVRMRRAELARQREREQLLAVREATQAALRQSEEQLRMALEAAALGTWSYALEAGELRWDARTRELFGVTPEEAVDSATWLRAVHPEDREAVEALARRVRAARVGEALELDYRVLGLRDGGVLRWLSARGRLFDAADGGGRCFSGTVLDITERKLGEQRAEDLQAATAALSHALTPQQVAEAVVAYGLKTLEAFAGVVSRVVGEELVVLSSVGYVEELVHPGMRLPLGLRSPATDAARTGQAVWVETPEALERGWPEMARARRDSRSRSWGALPLRDGARVVGVLGLSCATARRFTLQDKAHLESLSQLCAQTLERARLYEEEQRATTEARRRAGLEQQFLGMVSHDLRNPLQAISLAARTLQRMEQPTAEALLRLTGRIATSADTMGRMLSDLLDFTRGRLGGGIPLERAPCELVGLCREVVDEFSVTHPDGDVRLEGDALCEGWWDGQRLRQVLSNLVSNALRHARAGTPVWVRAEGRAGEVVLSVRNAGEPIPQQLRPVLFESYTRGNPRFRPSGSLGLGLYIVRQVVEGHGGTVEVASDEGATTFTVRLPRGLA
jgi:PAS domain S-box-containing protein